MTPTFTLIKKAFETYFKKQNFIYFLRIVLVQIVLSTTIGAIAVTLGGFIVGGVSYFYTGGIEGSYNPSFFAVLVPVVAIVIALVTILSSWVGAFNILAVSNVAKADLKGIKETLKLAWKKTWKFFLVNLLSGIIVLLGLVLFIVPGIIFGVWFSFAQFFVVEGSGVVESLKQSKKLVKGYFWPVVVRYIVLILGSMLIYMVVSSIPVVGPIALIFFGPFYILFSYLVFLDLKKLRKA